MFVKEKIKRVNGLLMERNENNADILLNINKIPTKDVKDLLLSAENLLKDFRSIGDDLNSSEIIKLYAQALEIMLDLKISIYFKSYVKEKYNNSYIHNKEIRIKFGNLQNGKRIPLTLWKNILRDFNDRIISEELKAFKVCLKGIINESILNTIEKICEFIIPFLIPKPYKKEIAMEEFISLRTLINKIIDLLYEK